MSWLLTFLCAQVIFRVAGWLLFSAVLLLTPVFQWLMAHGGADAWRVVGPWATCWWVWGGVLWALALLRDWLLPAKPLPDPLQMQRTRP